MQLLAYLACIGLLCGSLAADEPGLVAISISDADQSSNAGEERCEADGEIAVWRREPIATWLRERTDFQQLTQQEATKFIEQYEINEFPSLLVLTREGTLVDLFIACLPTKDVLKLLESDWEFHVGRVLNRQARRDLSARILEARRLRQTGDYKKASETYISCYEDVADLPAEYTTYFSLRILSDMLRSKQKDAATESWLRDLVVQLEDRILSCRGDEQDVQQFAFLLDKMGDTKRLMSAYEKVRASNCETLARTMAAVLPDELTRTKQDSEGNSRHSESRPALGVWCACDYLWLALLPALALGWWVFKVRKQRNR